ncbi:MAG TPA: pyridoxal phosphate-dependent aminotransferase [Lachnospiraceae bacterium]|jgi:aspartate aminotransferase|nr:pyridoxal phosphate-dependent aminotransferase [Lachnospiraceae bacterium]
MISTMIEGLIKNGSAVRAMFEEGKKMAAQFGKENVYDFSLGNPSVYPPEEINKEMINVINDTDPNYLHGYMSNAGYPEVREAVAKSLNKRFATNFSGNNILMTVGAAGGLNVILKTLLNPGDEVIVFAPFFGEYKNYIANFGGKIVIVSADIPNFQLKLDEFEQKINKNTKAVIINNPNNPSGVIYSEETIKKLAEILERKQAEFGTSIYLISDEPYRELAYDGEEVPYLTKYYKNTVVGYSFSKSLSLPGERIGYLVMPDELDDAESIIAGAAIANRILGFVNAPALQQLTIAKVLDSKVDVEIYNKNRELLYRKLTEFGYECIKPQGAFYMFIKAPGGDDQAFVQKAKSEHILLVGGTFFACPGYLRLAYCVDYDMIERSLPGFKRLIENA